jgi:hypothetical protein
MENVKIIDLSKFVRKTGNRGMYDRAISIYTSKTKTNGRMSLSTEVSEEVISKGLYCMQFAINQLTEEKYLVFTSDSGIKFKKESKGNRLRAYGNYAVEEMLKYFAYDDNQETITLTYELSKNMSNISNQLTYKLK